MNFYFRFLYFLYLVLILNNVKGQSLPVNPKSLPTPNAASLGLYGEVPVSHYTGLPNISIPLYNTKGSNLSLPISLNYHASGNRPEEQPGWVGLGWNLTVGGAITRTIKMQADEYDIGFNSSVRRKLGHYWWNYVGPSGTFPGFLSDPDWSDNDHMKYSPFQYLSSHEMDYSADTEPDEFSFNFLGYSGTFYLDQNHQWKVRSDKPLKVEFDDQFITPFISPLIGSFNTTRYLSKTFKHFTIIDEFGNRYIFGSETAENDNAIEYSAPLQSYTYGDSFYATTWYLTKIISANQSEVINYNYERGPFTSSASYNYTSWSIGQGGNGFFNPPCGESGSNYGTEMSGTLISPVYLKEITYPRRNIKIKFDYSKRNDHKYDRLDLYTTHLGYDGSQNHLTVKGNKNYIPFFERFPAEYDDFDGTKNFVWIKLNQILITDLNEELQIRKIKFSYIENSASRLKLNTIELIDKLNAPVQKYSFGYNPVQLPPYLMTITDHWGFNTGRVLNQPSVTNKYANLSVFYGTGNNLSDLLSPTGLYRTPNSGSLSSNKAEILETITYPTGGKTTFEYELHDYNKAVSLINRSQIENVTGYAGGLRISKIINTDNYGHNETKEYYYKRGYTANANVANLASSGVLNVKPTYTFGISQSPPVYFPQLGANLSYSYTMSTPIIPLTLNSSGVHVGYSEVVERLADGSYTIYKYGNHDVVGYTDPEPINEFPVLTTNEMTRYIRYRSAKNDRGKLLASEAYTNTGKLLLKKEIEYAVVGNTTTDVIRNVFRKHNNLCNFSGELGMGVSISIAYTIPYYVKLPSVEHEFVFNQQDSNYVHTSKSYNYDPATKLLKSVQSKTSDNRTTDSKFYYPNDFTSKVPYNEMVTKNMLDFVVKKEEILDNNLIRTDITSFKKWGLKNFAPDTVSVRNGNGAILDETIFYNYDNEGNLLEFARRNEGFKSSYIWGHESTLPTAFVKNASLADIAATSFESEDVDGQWEISSRGIVYDTTSYSGNYSFLASDRNYVGNYHNVDPQKRYIISFWGKAQPLVDGATLEKIGSTLNSWTYYQYRSNPGATGISISASTPTAIDELRLYPVDAQMITYTYNPLIGMTSQTDINNKSTYYEYDAFDRLIQIRDFKKDIASNYNYNYQKTAVVNTQANWKDLGGRRCVTFYGGNTGEQERQLTDINYYSPSYGSTKWESIGKTGNCELPVIYARLEYRNPSYDGTYDLINVYVAFYSDYQCTKPILINRPVKVNFTVNTYYNNNSSDDQQSVTLPAGTTSYYLGIDKFDLYHTHMITHYLNAGDYTPGNGW